jgi:hypothetical protein
MTPDPHLSDDALADLARRAAAWPDAPAPLLRAAIGLWPAPAVAGGAGAGAGAALQAVLREVLALLRFDSASLSPLALGMRGAEPGSGSRQLLYSADGCDVDLRITQTGPDRWRVAGQVLGPDDSGEVLLVAQDTAAGPTAAAAPSAASRHRAVLDALGEFALDGVASGRWRLSLQLSDRVVLLPPLPLGADPG